MANNFKNKFKSNIHFANTTQADLPTFANVGDYSVPLSCVATVIGLTISNMNTTTTATVDVQLNSGTGPDGNISIVKRAPVPIGGTLVAVGGDQKLVVEASQSVQVSASVGNVDAIMSILESDA